MLSARTIFLVTFVKQFADGNPVHVSRAVNTHTVEHSFCTYHK